MRSLLILLLLLCTLLAAAGATLRCDRSLIKGVNDWEISFARYDTDGPLNLECYGEWNSQKAIVFNSVRYESGLNCDEYHGWKELGLSADSELNVTCEEYCVVTGAGIAILTDDAGMSVICSDQEFDTIYAGEVYIGPRAWCSLKFGWNYRDGQSYTKLPHSVDTPLQLKCKDRRCERSFIKGVTDSEISFAPYETDVSHKLECRSDGNNQKTIVFKSVPYEFLKCNENDGWSYPLKSHEMDDFSDDDMIEIDSFYVTDRILGVATDSELSVTCEKYCVVTGGEGIAVERDGKRFILRCTDQEFGHIYAGEENLGKEAQCSLDHGWTYYEEDAEYEEYSVHTVDVLTPLQLECKPHAPKRFDRSLIKGGNAILDDVDNVPL